MEQCRAVCGPPGIAFSRVGFWNKLPQSKPDGFASFPFLSLRDIFPRPGEVVLWDGAFDTPENFAAMPKAPSLRELARRKP